MREALRYFTEKKLQLFLKIPFYLHINSPNYPGCINTKSKPYGIWNFEKSGFYREAVASQFFPKSIVETIRSDNPAILGLYHIGSLGTFTQSIGSDFDYWVMIDKKTFSKERYDSLEKKLDAIVGYCREKHDQKVSFFIMDQNDTRLNEYRTFSGEETLTAPKIFLKEEFYRTFLMIAGKIPVWSVLPSELSTDNSLKTQSTIRHILLDNLDLIDLGQISHIPKEDILKGLLWHICKSKADPVKAIIKATMIFSFGFGKNRSELLLCEKMKTRYAMAGIDDYDVDPYKALFDQILKFHETEDPGGISLIKNAIFYRLCGYPQVSMPAIHSPKRILLDKYIRTWNLNKNQVAKLLSYSSWSESEKLVLEQSFIQRLTMMVDHAKKSLGSLDHLIKSTEKRNWTILKNKTTERLSTKPHKIKECSTFLKRQKITELTIAKIKSGFSLNIATQKKEKPKTIYRHPDFLNVLGWVMENQLYKRQQCKLNCIGSKKVFESSDTPTDLDALYLKFSPLKPLSDHAFEYHPVWSKMLILVCYDSEQITHAEVMVSNCWGELFVKSIDLKSKRDRDDKILMLVKTMNEYRDKDLRTYICQYGQMYDPEIVYQVKKAYNDLNIETQKLNKSDKFKKKPFLDRL